MPCQMVLAGRRQGPLDEVCQHARRVRAAGFSNPGLSRPLTHPAWAGCGRDQRGRRQRDRRGLRRRRPGRATSPCASLLLRVLGWRLIHLPPCLYRVACLVRGCACGLSCFVLGGQASVQHLFRECQRAYGRLDVLFNNAGSDQGPCFLRADSARPGPNIRDAMCGGGGQGGAAR
jgi:NAD(P)-dependent dehydrogenase (short-subunit alcohol dehydrogenase family)